MEEEYLCLTDKVDHVIMDHKWKKLYRHPVSYDTQWVKDFYLNLINPSQMSLEVVVKDKTIQYSEATLHMMLWLKENHDTHQNLFEKTDENDLEDTKDSMC